MSLSLSSIKVEPQLLYTFIAGIILTYFVLRFLIVPLKYTWKFGKVVMKGAAAILLINAVGSFFTYIIPFNVANILLTGSLGVPGLVLVVAINRLLI